MRRLSLVALCLGIAVAVSGCGGSHHFRSATPPASVLRFLWASPPALPRACEGTGFADQRCEAGLRKAPHCTGAKGGNDSYFVCYRLVLRPDPNPWDRILGWLYRTLLS
jgi:hypothetical protein